jgi:hypothetical protein
MSKLHQLLAVEGDLEGTYKKVLEETKTNFIKHPDRYFGQHQRIEFFDENTPKEADSHKELDDTIPSKLAYTQNHITRYLDAVLQKERTNQEARADLIVDGVTIAKEVPATFLLGLENKLKIIRNSIYETIPTLQPGVKWERDESIGDGVYKRVHSDEKFRTKKVMKNHVIAEATKEHPAQVNVYNEDVKVARIVTDTWCGMISPAEKSTLLGRIDKLIRGVKKARQKANTTEVVKTTIGDELFTYING